MGHRVIGEPLGRQQADPRPEYNLLETGLRSHPCLQRLRLCSRLGNESVGFHLPQTIPDPPNTKRYY